MNIQSSDPMSYSGIHFFTCNQWHSISFNFFIYFKTNALNIDHSYIFLETPEDARNI